MTRVCLKNVYNLWAFEFTAFYTATYIYMVGTDIINIRKEKKRLVYV